MATIDHFSIYYINFEKVFEIAMLMDNQTVASLENTTGKDHKVKLGAKIQATLATIFSGVGEGSYEFSSTNNTKETIEVKYTNAIFLKSIMDQIDHDQKALESYAEGQLILHDVNLKISNEDEMRHMKLVKQGLLDKFIHEDISVGEMLKTITDDYAYLLSSDESNGRVLIKIPSKLENEFENNYTIDDILNGTTTVVGVYRGKRNLGDFNSTYKYMIENEEDYNSGDIIDSSEGKRVDNDQKEDEYHYLDILAVIQKINL